MEHGRDLDGLAPSTYEATLAFNLGDGYPVGVFLPLGVGAALRRHRRRLADPALHGLARRRCWRWRSGRSRRRWSRLARLRAAVAFVAAQPALLFGYYLWGGIKEVAAAALIAAVGRAAARARRASGPATRACSPLGARRRRRWSGCSSVGGLLWLAPVLVARAVLALRALGAARGRRPRGAARGAIAGRCSAPGADRAAGCCRRPRRRSPTPARSGNLIGPLEPAQVAGIWPAGDFRLDPVEPSRRLRC